MSGFSDRRSPCELQRSQNRTTGSLIVVVDDGLEVVLPFTDMLNNLPGSTNSGSFVTQINGGQKGDTEVYIDGGPASEWGISRGGLSEGSPMIDQVGEFSLVSNGFNAEYGGSGNSFVNVTINQALPHSLRGEVVTLG